MIVPCRSAQNGVWQNLGNKAREFPTSDLEQSHSPSSPNPSPPCKRGGEKRGKPPENQGEKILKRLQILTPEANTRKSPPNSLGSGGPGLRRARPRRESTYPAPSPSESLSTIHPTKMAAATTPRSPPHQPAPGVRKQR